MVDSVNSGYKEAAQAVAFSGTRTLVSLAIDEYTDLSDEVDNSSLKYLMADFEWVNTAVLTVTPASIEVFLVISMDDTNYPNWTGDGVVDLAENNQHYVGSFTLEVGTVAQRHPLRNVQMPPSKFKIGVRNKSGVALAASGSTLKFRRWGYSSQ